VEDAGLVPAAINITCYRGRTWHRPTLPGVPGAWAPRRFFFYSLFESDETGAPLAVRNRAGGSVDGYATQVGRWLVTRDGFDFLAFYLSDYDYHSHVLGPNGAMDVLARCDASIGALMDAAGGWEEFLERYAVVLCSDHGQTRVDRIVQLEESYADLRLFRRRGNAASADVAVTASNRAAQVYRLPSCRESVRSLAERLDREAGAQIVLFREGGEAVARRDGEELRFSPGSASGDLSILDHPNAHERAWAALANPNAGEILVSAAEGCEFADLGGRHHLGGGSHGSLVAGDSVVPVVTVGVEHDPVSITDLAPLCLAHLGVAPPAYARPPVRATA
jgi:hypothetical protein